MESGQFFRGGTMQGDRAPARRFENDASTSGNNGDPGWRKALLRVVETEILPRLRVSHRREGVPPSVATPENVEHFVRLLLANNGSEALAYALSLRERTGAADRDFLLLLARAARRFGELWEADLCDFVDVTIGLRQLHLLLSAMCAEVEAEVDIAPDARRVLLLPAPGETHGFGIAMVRYSFRAAGWRADCGLPSEYLSQCAQNGSTSSASP